MSTKYKIEHTEGCKLWGVYVWQKRSLWPGDAHWVFLGSHDSKKQAETSIKYVSEPVHTVDYYDKHGYRILESW